MIFTLNYFVAVQKTISQQNFLKFNKNFQG